MRRAGNASMCVRGLDFTRIGHEQGRIEERRQIPFTGNRQMEHSGSFGRFAQVEHTVSLP